jgi:menaquinone-specific isochorismate synthase
MTVADWQATRRAGISLADALAPLLARAARVTGPRPLTWVTVPAPALDAIDLFGAARALDLEAALWMQPAAGRWIVGIGRAWATEPDGDGRFELAASAWRELMESAIGPGEARGGPILLGGLGFSGRRPSHEDQWSEFGAASMVLPTFTVTQGLGGAPSLTIAIAPGRSEDPDPFEVEAAWARMDAMARAGGGTPTATETAASLRIVEERPDRAAWDRTVGRFAGAVGRGRIDKVVLARRVVLQASIELDVTGALRRLASTAPESTTFAFVRGGTTFLGATPERLVRTDGRAFETIAIAGSAPRGRDAHEDAAFAAALLASEKEREEHAVVVDGLRRDLAPIVERLEVAPAPAVLPLRHVQHLATPVTGTTLDEGGLLALAGRLHPTPAVGGAPRATALAMIDEHEGFDRGWYAGPVGWLGADGDGELMVALRCGLVAARTATLFAGCGIVADSEPEREWGESRLKLRTMLGALGGALDPEGPGA